MLFIMIILQGNSCYMLSLLIIFHSVLREGGAVLLKVLFNCMRMLISFLYCDLFYICVLFMVYGLRFMV